MSSIILLEIMNIVKLLKVGLLEPLIEDDYLMLMMNDEKALGDLGVNN